MVNSVCETFGQTPFCDFLKCIATITSVFYLLYTSSLDCSMLSQDVELKTFYDMSLIDTPLLLFVACHWASSLYYSKEISHLLWSIETKPAV